MGSKFMKRIAVGLLAVMLGVSSPVGTIIENPMVITAEAATAKPKLTAKKASIVVGKTKTITLKNNKKALKWSTSKKSVASIKADGNKVVITGKKAGKATVTAKVGKNKYKCTVTVKNSPKISNKTRSVTVGAMTDVDITGVSSNAKVTIGNKKIVEVGLEEARTGFRSYYIKGKKEGKTTVKFKVHGKTLKCTVTVKEPEVVKQEEVNYHIGTYDFPKSDIKPVNNQISPYYDAWEVSGIKYALNWALKGASPSNMSLSTRNNLPFSIATPVKLGRFYLNSIDISKNVKIDRNLVTWNIENPDIVEINYRDSTSENMCGMTITAKKVGTTKVTFGYRGLEWTRTVTVTE